MKPPKQNSHYVVVERGSFPVLSSQKWHQQVIFNAGSKAREGRERGQQTIVSCVNWLIAINSHSAEHL